MGCSNSHFRPIFRRCRRKSKDNKEDNAYSATTNNDTTASINLKEHFDDIHYCENETMQRFHFLGNSIKGIDPSSFGSNGCNDNDTNSQFNVPLVAQSSASKSQIDFFKMLDDKIEQGPDYQSEDEEHYQAMIRKTQIGYYQTNVDTYIDSKNNQSTFENVWSETRLPSNNEVDSNIRWQWNENAG